MGSDDGCEGIAPVMVMYGNLSGAIWALGVASKELDTCVVDYVVSKLDFAGYRGQRVALKSEGEPAIVALKTAVAATRVGTTPCDCFTGA